MGTKKNTNHSKTKRKSFQNSAVVVFLFRWMLRGSSSRCLRSLRTKSSSSFISSSVSSPSKTALAAFASFCARGGPRTEGTRFFIPSRRRHHRDPSLNNNRFSPSLSLSSLSPHRRTRRPTPARGTEGLFFASLSPVGPQLASFSAAASSSLSVFSSTTNMVSVAWIVGVASIVDFGIQLVGWAISSAMKTEKYYDLCGSGAFAAVAVSTFACTNGEPRAALATTALLAWAMRLGAFLVTRVHKDGGDKRFDGIKEDPATFGIYWFIQGIWVLVTAMPVILINANAVTQGPLRALDWIGFAIFAVGLTMETVADQQKRAFKADERNKGRYIDSGLWSVSRHPNYFGEITLWTGLSMVGLSGVAKYGAGEIIGCVLSPLLVTFLITQLSGIPLLEKSADERWGNEEAYQKYKRETPTLVPYIGGK